MSVPSPFAFMLLALAVFRVWHLLSEDAIMEKPRQWLIAPGWKTGGPAKRYREWLETWLTCPWCAGAWLSAAAWGLWLVWPHWTLVACVPVAVSGLVGLLGHVSSSD